MSKKRPRIPALAMGVILTFVVLTLYLLQWGFLESIELKTFDLRARLNRARSHASGVVIVSIDDESIAKMGRWPWPRSAIAGMIGLLSECKARVIGVDILFSEPEKNQGLREIQKLKEVFLSRTLKARPTREMRQFLAHLQEAEANLNNDSKLMSSVKKAGNVILPMYFTLDSPLLSPADALPPYLERSSLNHITKGGDGPVYPIVEAKGITAPIPEISIGSAGVGHINKSVDIDGVTRWEILVIKYGKWYYPSFSLQVVMRYLNLDSESRRIILGEGIDLGGQLIPTDESMRLLIWYRHPDGSFPHYSFFDVLNGKVSPEVFKGKIVLLGSTAQGIGDFAITPVSSNVPGVEISANVIHSILTKRFLVRPAWAFAVEVGIILLFGAFISFFLPRLRAKWGLIIMGALLVAFILGVSYVFIEQGIWS